MFVLSLSALVTACSPDSGDREQMVNLQEVKDNPETELANLTAAIKQAGRDGSLFARRAVLYLRKGELGKALSDANEAVKLTRNDPASLFVKAQVLQAMGREKEALPLALQAERNSYQSASLYVLLSELYLQRHEYRQALGYIRKAQELSPANEFAFYYRGRILAATGDTASAIQNYKLALAQAEGFMEPKRELAGLLIAKNDLEAATPYLVAAEKQAPKDAQVWYYQGLLYQANQKADSAAIFFRKALALNDTLAGPHFQLGMQQYKQGNYEGAITQLERVADPYGRRSEYLIALAGSYERTGQYLKALELYQRLVALGPKYAFANKSIDRLKQKLQGTKPDTIAVQQAITE
jgi:tetratricopeptide (TPR) repeat protein